MHSKALLRGTLLTAQAAQAAVQASRTVSRSAERGGGEAELRLDQRSELSGTVHFGSGVGRARSAAWSDPPPRAARRPRGSASAGFSWTDWTRVVGAKRQQGEASRGCARPARCGTSASGSEIHAAHSAHATHTSHAAHSPHAAATRGCGLLLLRDLGDEGFRGEEQAGD